MKYYIDVASNTLEVFDALVSEDSGFYTCLAWNTVGTDQHTVLVQVTDTTSNYNPRVCMYVCAFVCMCNYVHMYCMYMHVCMCMCMYVCAS